MQAIVYHYTLSYENFDKPVVVTFNFLTCIIPVDIRYTILNFSVSSPKASTNLLTTFRTKLNIRRKNNQTNEEEAPAAVYRKTDDSAQGTSKQHDPEAPPSELSPLTTESKDTDGETYELANENPPLAEREESPKDGGTENTKLLPPEVVIVPGTPDPSEYNLASKADNESNEQA